MPSHGIRQGMQRDKRFASSPVWNWKQPTATATLQVATIDVNGGQGKRKGMVRGLRMNMMKTLVAGRDLVGIGPGSCGTICPGSSHEPGPMVLAAGPQPLVPVRGMNRDRRGGFSPGSCHEPVQISCLYTPIAAA